MHNLMQVYKKTKKFEMKSLKKRIFKHQLTETSVNKTEDDENHGRHDTRQIFKCSTTLLQPHSSHQLSSCQLIDQSRKKNKLRSFIDRTVHDMNKAELQRLKTEGNVAIVK